MIYVQQIINKYWRNEKGKKKTETADQIVMQQSGEERPPVDDNMRKWIRNKWKETLSIVTMDTVDVRRAYSSLTI